MTHVEQPQEDKNKEFAELLNKILTGNETKGDVDRALKLEKDLAKKKEQS